LNLSEARLAVRIPKKANFCVACRTTGIVSQD
jgi:hypothetical protein